jgi:hypothetical protein
VHDDNAIEHVVLLKLARAQPRKVKLLQRWRQLFSPRQRHQVHVFDLFRPGRHHAEPLPAVQILVEGNKVDMVVWHAWGEGNNVENLARAVKLLNVGPHLCGLDPARHDQWTVQGRVEVEGWLA